MTRGSVTDEHADQLATPNSQPAVALGIGDDMAAIAARGELVLVSSDMLLDGVHFDLYRYNPSFVGRKAIASADQRPTPVRTFASYAVWFPCSRRKNRSIQSMSIGASGS